MREGREVRGEGGVERGRCECEGGVGVRGEGVGV